MIRMSPCRLQSTRPGFRPLGEHNPLLSPCRVLAVPCLHFSPAAAEAGVRWRRHPRIRQSPVCRCRWFQLSPGPIPPVRGLIIASVALRHLLPLFSRWSKTGRKPCIQPPIIATGSAVPSL